MPAIGFDGSPAVAAFNVALAALAVGATVVLLSPRLRADDAWRATVTPLASIIGSGFLVVAPLLGFAAGAWAVVAMAVILAAAWAVGDAVRYNIAHVEELDEGGPAAPGADAAAVLSWMGRAAKLALALAYVVAVAFYLELLGAFLMRLLGVEGVVHQKLIATVLIGFIGVYGLARGLRPLEELEAFAVGLKLAIIAALLAGLLVHNAALAAGGAWRPPDLSPHWSLETARVLMGAFLIVQGFETSRYLRGVYPPDLRIRTMARAQLIAGAVYLSFVALATVLLDSVRGVDETGVIDLSAQVAAVLPLMLVLGAVASQFSAAVADTIGSGGLVEEFSRGRAPRRAVYAAVAVLALVLIWTIDIFAIIADASRAFALYYAIQALMAAIHAFSATGGRRRARGAGFAGVSAAMLAVAVFALPADALAR